MSYRFTILLLTALAAGAWLIALLEAAGVIR